MTWDTDARAYETIIVDFGGNVCRVALNRPEADNAINGRMIEECLHALRTHGREANVVVLEGSAGHFCAGADFAELSGSGKPSDPGPLYDLYLELAQGPFVSIAHVVGKANAGGVGLVAACDIAIAAATARFSLSELLFGIYPACVHPFLARRCGAQNARYMTLMTREFTAAEAAQMRLVDALGEDSAALLRRHLSRLKCISKTGIERYKRYIYSLDNSLAEARTAAIAGNLEVFRDSRNLELIRRYIEQGVMPWER